MSIITVGPSRGRTSVTDTRKTKALWLLLASAIIMAGLAPLGYLRADARDASAAATDAKATINTHVAQEKERWISVDRRLTAIEADVRFLRDQAVKGLVGVTP